MRLFALILLTLFCTEAHTEEIVGKVHVIDGDSIRIKGQEIRLHGIDAPEAEQSCRIEGEDWACGKASSEALQLIVGDADLRCEWTQLDRYERALATCYRGEFIDRGGRRGETIDCCQAQFRLEIQVRQS